MANVHYFKQQLREERYLNSAILVWGLSYWFAALIKPDLVGNVSPTISAASMVLMGVLILGNLFAESRVLWGLIGLFMTSGIISSWVLSTQWNVPYSPVTAGLSMALLNALTGVLAFAKALE